MAEIKWDINIRGEIYRGVSDSRLQRWISTGKIKPKEALVWHSGFSGWRKPEELKELRPFFMVQKSKKHFPVPLRKSLKVIAEGDFLELNEKPRLKKINRKRPINRVLPSKKKKGTLVIEDKKNSRWPLSDILHRSFLTKR